VGGARQAYRKRVRRECKTFGSKPIAGAGAQPRAKQHTPPFPPQAVAARKVRRRRLNIGGRIPDMQAAANRQRSAAVQRSRAACQTSVAPNALSKQPRTPEHDSEEMKREADRGIEFQ